MDKNEAYMMSAIASDFVTGNYLLGRPRDKKQMETMHEISVAFTKIDDGDPLTARAKELLSKLSEQFYGGAEDMCEQLGADFNKYTKATEIR
jgi:hypothetical protein